MATVGLKSINLAVGWPNPNLLAVDGLRKASADVFLHPDIRAKGSPLGYATDEGSEVLRKSIAEWLTRFYQIGQLIPAENICITGGASQNLACILQTFTDPAFTRNVWMVVPTYMCAIRIFEDSGFAQKLRGVREVGGGIDFVWFKEQLGVSEAVARAGGELFPKYKTSKPWRKIYKHVVYAVPTYSNPCGTVMDLRCRQDLVRLAREFDALIVTDDIYDMVQWDNTGVETHIPTTACLPRIVDIDGHLDGGPKDAFGHSVSNGSFSKLVGPGCRTGWCQGTKKLIYGISQTGSTRSGGAPSQFAASFIHHFLKEAMMEDFLEGQLLPEYALRHKMMLSAIEQHLVPLGVHLPQSGWNGRSGGFFIWIHLPDKVTAQSLAQRALKDKALVIMAGTEFEVETMKGLEDALSKRCIRLSFSWESKENLAAGVVRLASVLRELLQE
ncbi:Valine--pyruvate aminotransferase [Conoideocrella luteorostrata]|uniref:Valine--pyruvate aminotransferase n=1 Tax=Conoideocrella luteorostrata TaxID=1105319 RepID=A0AAJ0CTH2_9HYPO|nr:Valine--pyruvate aminotransferase [Conoideocrella luteorostrata]